MCKHLTTLGLALALGGWVWAVLIVIFRLPPFVAPGDPPTPPMFDTLFRSPGADAQEVLSSILGSSLLLLGAVACAVVALNRLQRANLQDRSPIARVSDPAVLFVGGTTGLLTVSKSLIYPIMEALVRRGLLIGSSKVFVGNAHHMVSDLPRPGVWRYDVDGDSRFSDLDTWGTVVVIVTQVTGAVIGGLFLFFVFDEIRNRLERFLSKHAPHQRSAAAVGHRTLLFRGPALTLIIVTLTALALCGTPCMPIALLLLLLALGVLHYGGYKFGSWLNDSTAQRLAIAVFLGLALLWCSLGLSASEEDVFYDVGNRIMPDALLVTGFPIHGIDVRIVDHHEGYLFVGRGVLILLANFVLLAAGAWLLTLWVPRRALMTVQHGSLALALVSGVYGLIWLVGVT